MCRSRFLLFLLALTLALTPLSALALETDCDDVYCFTPGDFSENTTQELRGVCITGLPDPATGTVLLGHRVVQRGDILTAEQLSKLTFSPLRTEVDVTAEVSYLPIFDNRVAPAATIAIAVRGKTDKAPVAQDVSLETYKNLSLDGNLKVSDPEGQKLTYSVLRAPRRGQVKIKENGTFVYTPKKNKVGVDSFTYTAADPAGNVSRTATVTIQILKPTDARQYADTQDTAYRFSAEWLRHTGLFTGESVNGQLRFCPDAPVSRGEFLAMLVKALDIPLKDDAYAQLPANTPLWLQPYLAAALRAGLTAGWPDVSSFTETITGGEVAVMLQNALDLTVSGEILDDIPAGKEDEPIPTWAEVSLAVMANHGMVLGAYQQMTRGEVSLLLYQVSHMEEAAGAAVYRMQ